MNKISRFRPLLVILAAILASVGISAYCSLPAGSFVTILLVICFSFLFHAVPVRKPHGTTVLLAAVFSILLAMGGYADYASSSYAILRKLAVAEVVLGMFIVLCYTIEQLITLNFNRNSIDQANLHFKYSEKQVFLFLSILCFILYLPYYLALFPGRLSGDSVYQIQQCYGIYPFDSWHPFIHTLMINALCHIGTSIWGTYNAGVAVYSTVQMLLGILLFAYTLTVLYRFGASRVSILLGIGFYMLLLYNPWYSLTMWKDVPYAYLMLLFSVRLFVMVKQPDPLRPRDWIIYFCIGVLLSLFRHAGFVAFILISPVLLFTFHKQLRPALISIAGVFVTVILFHGPMSKALNLKSSGVFEAMSIPLQQIARVYAEEREISPEDDALLAQLADTSVLADNYLEYISDPIKNHFTDGGNQDLFLKNIGEYIKLWMRLGQQYPDTYMRAFVAQTKYFWHPCTQDADRSVNTWTAGSGPLNIHPQPLLPYTVQELLIDLSRQHARFPIYGHLFSTGLFAFALLFCMVLARRKHLSLLPLLPLFWSHLIFIFTTPVTDEFRYMYSLMITVPFLLIAVCTLHNKSEKQEYTPVSPVKPTNPDSCL